MVQPTQAAHSDYGDAVRETLHTELYRLQAYLLALVWPAYWRVPGRDWAVTSQDWRA
jgi:hypothetical protein